MLSTSLYIAQSRCELSWVVYSTHIHATSLYTIVCRCVVAQNVWRSDNVTACSLYWIKCDHFQSIGQPFCSLEPCTIYSYFSLVFSIVCTFARSLSFIPSNRIQMSRCTCDFMNSAPIAKSISRWCGWFSGTVCM